MSRPDAAHATAASFAALTQKLGYLSPSDIEEVRRAYRFADQAHLGQKRKNGLPYITHPIEVATLCTEWKLDAPALMAALLHDTIEDCGITKADLVEQFSAPVAELVDGLTKLEKVEKLSREENQAESFRKMLLAMARDVRVILIKLADRLHNMRTMGDMPRTSWGRISQETLDIYAPIAHRLGLNAIYRELQERAFAHLMPWRHSILRKAVQRARSRNRDLIHKIQGDVDQALKQAHVQARLEGREKSLFSLYQKMQSKQMSFAQINDLYGVRVVVPSVLDCYLVLGVLHQLYKPVPGRFKDHIAIAKSNGYQSLHTTLVGPSSVHIEFQVRTEAMDVVAESGVAAHWLYKEREQAQDSRYLSTQWLQSLLDIQTETRDAAEFWDHVKVDLFPDSLYVFTPKRKIISLPKGATVIDFAYAIHSNVGDHTVAARVNGELVPLSTALRNGDVVEILTEPLAQPDPAWLHFVRTGRARSKIRHYLKHLQHVESIALGHSMLSSAMRAEGFDPLPWPAAESPALWEKLLHFSGNKSADDLMTDIGLGRKMAAIIAKRAASMLLESGIKPNALLITQERFTNNEARTSVILDGRENSIVQYASCCHPLPPEPIVGHLGHGEGLTVHHRSCAVASRLLQKDPERLIEVEWSDDIERQFQCVISTVVHNGKGVLARLATTLAECEADIIHIDMGKEVAQDFAHLRLTVAVSDHNHLQIVLQSLQRSPIVVSAQRVGIQE